MNRDLIKKDLVQLDWMVKDRDDYFRKMVAKLEERGYVYDTFLDAILEREARYPTALPTVPEAIAIPHCDIQHVIKSFIAVTRLKKPVEWHEMGKNEVTHRVRYAFMLGFTQGDGHIDVLQILLKNFMEPTYINNLDNAETEAEFCAAVQSLKGLED